jgi:8-oxo-dGTP pyrophosphatase MutT (NUDIX family)
MAEPGENFAEAAARELREETGLAIAASRLVELGVHRYLRGKDLALFAWTPPELPDPESLSCSSYFTLANGAQLPEFDRFGLFPWQDGVARVGKNLARVLTSIPRDGLRGASK